MSLFISGLSASAGAVICAKAVEKLDKRVHLVVTSSRDKAVAFCNDLYNFIDDERVFYFPLSKDINSKYSIRDASQKVQRTSAIAAIDNYTQSNELIIVTYPDSLDEEVIYGNKLKNSILKIKIGDKLSHSFIKELLFENGFNKVDFVSEPGEFALRGSIIDLFSYSNNNPYRIDFFGDEIESIKEFNNDTQISTKELKEIDIYPNIFNTTSQENKTNFINLLPEDSIIWFFDRELYQNREWYLSSNSSFNCVYDSLPKNYDGEIGNVKSQTELLDKVKNILESPKTSSQYCYLYSTVPQPTFNKNFDILLSDIKIKAKEGYQINILTDNVTQNERLNRIIKEIKTNLSNDYSFILGRENWLNVEQLSLSEGFIDNVDKICYYTDHQIFERYHKIKVKRTVEKSERLTINELNAFQRGDYVVHIDHGVGQFDGLVKINVNGKLQEAIKLVYKDGDVLFVSIHGIHRISRYKSKDGTPPKIYKLGSKTWENLKNNTKSKVKDIAANLIKLYSERSASRGFAFSPDTYLQTELESSFMYEDTPDQHKATLAIKEDMERSCPMDRLVCGDVGFGKTEIAIRAAFKAVADSKQVAVLVPTTILAFQHYNTFKSRLNDFPCNIEYISRMRSAKDIKDILKRLKEGKIDIIIGTHRLLNKSVEFKDLGLLIIDEEQKFGVSAKERLRELKTSVDTLTLTATPIPRTLQFSLLGARDLSIINTPPPNRLPVHTELMDFDYEKIREILDYELNRGGQIFFIHNKIDDLLSIQAIIERIVPKAKTAIAHGQMEATKLEGIIMDFIQAEYDILICTSIVENGIDIPNVNTIIINQAQNFGLSDLHQLRGRVGRSNKKAFCYLISPPLETLPDDSRRRLQAIETFSELGSGFNIAMQDLDIRGAGNLLGGEQSGFIAEMGFETYQKILNEALSELEPLTTAFNRGKSEHLNQQLPLPATRYAASDCHIDTDMDISIPDEYISITAEKIRLYKQLDSMTENYELEKFEKEIEDRYGAIPNQFKELMTVVKLRSLAKELGFERIVLKNNTLVAYFISNQLSAYFKSDLFTRILSSIQKGGRKFNIKEQNNKLYIVVQGVNSVKKAFDILSTL